jgi:hypothetical protein
MSRWLVLAVFSMVPLALLGCGSSLRAGLSNAPNLGGSPIADGRANGVVSNGISDVIANGDDACGRYAEHGVLRNQMPPCPTWTPAHSIASASPPPSPADDASRGLVQPWLNHFYTGWPCPETGAAARTSRKGHAWSSLDATVAECAVPQQ